MCWSIELMGNENFGISYRICKYVYEAFVIRQNTINTVILLLTYYYIC